jgi:hypothetical protein
MSQLLIQQYLNEIDSLREFYKEKVIDLLMRATRVSVETVAITEEMKQARR